LQQETRYELITSEWPLYNKKRHHHDYGTTITQIELPELPRNKVSRRQILGQQQYRDCGYVGLCVSEQLRAEFDGKANEAHTR
jgi:hypothetical protein